MRVNCKQCKATFVSKKFLKKGICKICIDDKKLEDELKVFRDSKKPNQNWKLK